MIKSMTLIRLLILQFLQCLVWVIFSIGTVSGQDKAKTTKFSYCAYSDTRLAKEGAPAVTKESIDICTKMYNIRSYSGNYDAVTTVKKILSHVGLKKVPFTIQQCSNINNCIAYSDENNIRYIIYDEQFLKKIANATQNNANADWAAVAIFAHEIGHHLSGHTISKPVNEETRRNQELEADEYAGFILQKLKARQNQALRVLDHLPHPDCNDESGYTHPCKEKRARAIRQGFADALAQNALDIDDSQSPEALYNTGLELAKIGKNQEAIKCYDYAIRLNDKYAEAFNNRGLAKRTLKAEKSNEEAIKDYDAAIDLHPGYAEAYFNRGNANRALKQYQQAIADYNKAIDLDRRYFAAYNNRGLAKKASGTPNANEEAIKDYTEAIKLDSNNSDAYYNRGLANYHASRYDEALADFSKVTKLNPRSAMAYYQKGLIKFDLKQYAEAVLDYSKSIDIRPNHAAAYYFRAVAKEANKQDACPDYRRACQLNYDNACQRVCQ